ncbi:MAG: hypothetical protein K9L64_00375 [Candidatus Izimaplasma sp.]|nr:hypothetical protein [Candidatus Izimaplasma bacterium]
MVKKIFFIVIIIYIAISGILLYVNKTKPTDEISLLAVKKTYSRLITDEEVIDLPIYITQEKSFLIDKENILDARIGDKYNELEVNIKEIKNANKMINYENTQYYLFYFQIDFSEVDISNLELNFINSTLYLSYINDELVELDIGKINLLFRTIDNPNHLDFSRMFSITNKEDEYNVIKAIYLELDNRTGENIIINEISFLNNELKANIEQIKSINFMPDYNSDFKDLMPQFNTLTTEFINNKTFNLINKQNLLIPINHLEEWQYINRFPLIIKYTYNDISYEYIIDDFLFFSSINDIENENYEKSIYKYLY